MYIIYSILSNHFQQQHFLYADYNGASAALQKSLKVYFFFPHLQWIVRASLCFLYAQHIYYAIACASDQ